MAKCKHIQIQWGNQRLTDELLSSALDKLQLASASILRYMQAEEVSK